MQFSRLEDTDIVCGYHVDVDYDLVGCPLYTEIVCTTPVLECSALVNRARDAHGVTTVRGVMTDERNTCVNAIRTDHDDLNRISERLDGLGLDIVDGQLIRDEFVCPYHEFLDEDGADQ